MKSDANHQHKNLHTLETIFPVSSFRKIIISFLPAFVPFTSSELTSISKTTTPSALQICSFSLILTQQCSLRKRTSIGPFALNLKLVIFSLSVKLLNFCSALYILDFSQTIQIFRGSSSFVSIKT